MNKQILHQGKKIFYRITGSGQPVILLHGFGEDGEVWRSSQAPPPEGFKTPVMDNPSLYGRFKFIVPDLPGSGQSEMIDDMSMEGLAEVVKTIIDTESENPLAGGKEACIIGHSMGGYITLAFVEKYPDHVSAFGLFHSSAFADSEEKKASRRKAIEFVQEHGAFKFLKTATPDLFSPTTKDENPGLIDKQVASLHNFSAAAFVSYYEAMIQRPDRTEVLRQATVPVLFIMGKYDVAVPLEDGLKQCHLPGKSYIHILQQSGHMGMLEEPGNSNRMLEEFLLET